MSPDRLLGARPVFAASSRTPGLFLLRTDLIFETSKRAFRIKFVDEND